MKAASKKHKQAVGAGDKGMRKSKTVGTGLNTQTAGKGVRKSHTRKHSAKVSMRRSSASVIERSGSIPLNLRYAAGKRKSSVKKRHLGSVVRKKGQKTDHDSDSDDSIIFAAD